MTENDCLRFIHNIHIIHKIQAGYKKTETAGKIRFPFGNRYVIISHAPAEPDEEWEKAGVQTESGAESG